MTSRKFKSAPRPTTYKSPPSTQPPPIIPSCSCGPQYSQPPNQTTEYVPKSNVNPQQSATFQFSVASRNEYSSGNEPSIQSKQSRVDSRKSKPTLVQLNNHDDIQCILMKLAVSLDNTSKFVYRKIKLVYNEQKLDHQRSNLAKLIPSEQFQQYKLIAQYLQAIDQKKQYEPYRFQMERMLEEKWNKQEQKNLQNEAPDTQNKSEWMEKQRANIAVSRGNHNKMKSPTKSLHDLSWGWMYRSEDKEGDNDDEIARDILLLLDYENKTIINEIEQGKWMVSQAEKDESALPKRIEKRIITLDKNNIELRQDMKKVRNILVELEERNSKLFRVKSALNKIYKEPDLVLHYEKKIKSVCTETISKTNLQQSQTSNRQAQSRKADDILQLAQTLENELNKMKLDGYNLNPEILQKFNIINGLSQQLNKKRGADNSEEYCEICERERREKKAAALAKKQNKNSSKRKNDQNTCEICEEEKQQMKATAISKLDHANELNVNKKNSFKNMCEICEDEKRQLIGNESYMNKTNSFKNICVICEDEKREMNGNEHYVNQKNSFKNICAICEDEKNEMKGIEPYINKTNSFKNICMICEDEKREMQGNNLPKNSSNTNSIQPYKKSDPSINAYESVLNVTEFNPKPITKLINSNQKDTAPRDTQTTPSLYTPPSTGMTSQAGNQVCDEDINSDTTYNTMPAIEIRDKSVEKTISSQQNTAQIDEKTSKTLNEPENILQPAVVPKTGKGNMTKIKTQPKPTTDQDAKKKKPSSDKSKNMDKPKNTKDGKKPCNIFSICQGVDKKSIDESVKSVKSVPTKNFESKKPKPIAAVDPQSGPPKSSNTSKGCKDDSQPCGKASDGDPAGTPAGASACHKKNCYCSKCKGPKKRVEQAKAKNRDELIEEILTKMSPKAPIQQNKNDIQSAISWHDPDSISNVNQLRDISSDSDERSLDGTQFNAGKWIWDKDLSRYIEKHSKSKIPAPMSTGTQYNGDNQSWDEDLGRYTEPNSKSKAAAITGNQIWDKDLGRYYDKNSKPSAKTKSHKGCNEKACDCTDCQGGENIKEITRNEFRRKPNSKQKPNANLNVGQNDDNSKNVCEICEFENKIRNERTKTPAKLRNNNRGKTSMDNEHCKVHKGNYNKYNTALTSSEKLYILSINMRKRN